MKSPLFQVYGNFEKLKFFEIPLYKMIMEKSSKMRKKLSLVACCLIFLTGCSNLISVNENPSGQSEQIQYGSLVVGGVDSSRAIDVSAITSATVSVSGNGIDSDISKEVDGISGGISSGITLEKIPAGKNRVVTVKSNVDGAVIRALVDIEAGKTAICVVKWSTTAVANIFYNLIKTEKIDVSSINKSEFDSYIPAVHASLVNASAIASDYKSGSLKTAADYVLDYENVKVTAKGIAGWTVQITDIASEKKMVESDDESFVLKAAPGTWKIWVFDENGGLKSDFVKDITVSENNESSLNIVHVGGGLPVSGKIVVHVPRSLGYSHVWAWKTGEDSVNYTGGTWPGKQMTLNGDFYDFTIEGKTSSALIFNNGSGGSAGNGQTSDLYLTEGEWNYIGGASGTADKTGSSIPANFEKSSVEEKLSVVYKSGDEIEPSTPTRLGAFYEKIATSFSIWSPDSSDVKIAVKKQGESDFTEYTCKKGFVVDGNYPDNSNIYGVTVTGDCNLAEYQFFIAGIAVRDPYGKMVKYVENSIPSCGNKLIPQSENVLCNNKAFYENGPSGSSWAGPSVNIVVDAENILPSDGSWAERPALERRTDAIVYEVHVQDFTSSSTWNGTESNRGKFKGMTESGTTYTNGSATVKTGLDHLKELGVTHVQIMPMYDFATKYVNSTGQFYNWGYDPVNYNVPEDRYSTCPGDYVERIREVKDMVNEFHKNGIRVVMDVVYNHTFANEMFGNITGKYYTAKDLSGCGNSIDVSNAMVSRMVRDSLEYWAEIYNIDGFRFDLMAIFTKNALNDWGTYLNNTNPETKDRNLLMQGEPWQCNNNQSADYGYASAIPGLANAHIGCFTGKWRETLKGSSDDGNTLGYIFSGRQDKDGSNTLLNTTVGIRGSGTGLGSDSEGVWTRYFTANPEQAVNYLMAHDNLCFYDKIRAAGTDYMGYADAIVKFGHGILLVSQGIPFIHAGDEFLRTKAVGTFASEAHNSYMWGIEMNQIDWALKAENLGCFNYHKDVIHFRKENDGLRYRSGVGETSIDGNVIYYTIKNSPASPENKNCTLKIIINPNSNFEYQGIGTMVINKTGSVSESDRTCEGTGVTIFISSSPQ